MLHIERPTLQGDVLAVHQFLPHLISSLFENEVRTWAGQPEFGNSAFFYRNVHLHIQLSRAVAQIPACVAFTILPSQLMRRSTSPSNFTPNNTPNNTSELRPPKIAFPELADEISDTLPQIFILHFGFTSPVFRLVHVNMTDSVLAYVKKTDRLTDTEIKNRGPVIEHTEHP